MIPAERLHTLAAYPIGRCAASQRARCWPGKATGPAPTKSRRRRPAKNAGHRRRSSRPYRVGLYLLHGPVGLQKGGVLGSVRVNWRKLSLSVTVTENAISLYRDSHA